MFCMPHCLAAQGSLTNLAKVAPAAGISWLVFEVRLWWFLLPRSGCWTRSVMVLIGCVLAAATPLD